jgi:hypothetical protein
MTERDQPDLQIAARGERRWRERIIGQRLGFATPNDFRVLIAQHHEELRRYGELIQCEEYLLNQKQAIYLARVANTPMGEAIRSELFKAAVMADLRGLPAPYDIDS